MYVAFLLLPYFYYLHVVLDFLDSLRNLRIKYKTNLHQIFRIGRR